MTRGVAICLLGVALLVAVLAGGAVGGGNPAASVGLLQPQTTPDEFDDTVFRIQVYENQSARWTIVYSRPLSNQSEIDAFETFAAEFNDNETELFTDFTARATDLVAFGENATGRPMNSTSFARQAFTRQLGGTRGFVEMSFMWTNFARADGERVLVDDVFQGGMYVADGQRLVFQRGPTLAFRQVEPQPDSMAATDNLDGSSSVTWFGERQFADQRPSLVFGPRESGAVGGGAGQTTIQPPAATGTPTGTPTPVGNGQNGSNLPMGMMLAGGILLVALGVGLGWYTGRLPTGEYPARGDTSSPEAVSTGETDASAAVQPEEFRSDEDLVEQLLQDNGGRMKQVSIVEETDWSKSKVSMLLSEMEADGRISKLRVGRENIISLAGQEPDAAGSPFDEE